METHTIPPGYAYGLVAESPVSTEELALLLKTLLFTEADVAALRQAGQMLVPQTDAILDVWYGFVGGNPHLLAYFSQGGTPDGAYLGKVRARFAQWIADTCNRAYDATWLAYQQEIALRHHSSKKNQTDDAQAVPIIHFRYLIAFVVPITVTIRPFLANGGASAEDVEAMYNAWFKAITLTALLWSYPYVQPNQF